MRSRFLKPNAMKKNDCYKCPYREQVPGSAHSKCKVLTNGAIAFAFAMKVASGEFTGMDNNEGQALKFDPHGVKNGWCFWPINFDPVWVECYLPIENNDKT